jgi:hypothetical protein
MQMIFGLYKVKLAFVANLAEHRHIVSKARIENLLQLFLIHTTRRADHQSAKEKERIEF